MLGCRPYETLIESNHCLQVNEGYQLIDIGRYQRLVGKLIYLTLTRPNSSYAMGVASQFMHSPMMKHLKAAYYILQYLKKSLSQ